MPITDSSGRTHFRLFERHDMLLPRTRIQLGRRSFHVATHIAWNSLPKVSTVQRSASISPRQFRNVLHTPPLNAGLHMIPDIPLKTYVEECRPKTRGSQPEKSP